MKKSVRDSLVHKVVEEIYDEYPYLLEKFGENGVERTEEDNHHHLDHLQAAYEMHSVYFFIDYTEWLNNVLTSRGVGTFLIEDNYMRLIRLLDQAEGGNYQEKTAYIEYLQEARQHLRTLSK